MITAAELRRVSDTAIILDASWVYPPFNHAGVDVRRRYAEAHIPGSWFLDLAALSDPARSCDPRVKAIAPPRTETVHAVMARAGADPGSLIVVTGMDRGCTTAPFARHVLVDAGYLDVRLLDGGTPAWRAGIPRQHRSGPRSRDRRRSPRTARSPVVVQ